MGTVGYPGWWGRRGGEGKPGEKGDMGVRGRDGESGMNGRQGEPGMMGPKGEQVKYIVYFCICHLRFSSRLIKKLHL